MTITLDMAETHGSHGTLLPGRWTVSYDRPDCVFFAVAVEVAIFNVMGGVGTLVGADGRHRFP